VRLNTWRYRLTRDPQEALRQRLRELAAVRVRFGYRRLTVLLRREGWKVAAFKQTLDALPNVIVFLCRVCGHRWSTQEATGPKH
jgi:rubrerythrin